MPAPNPEYNRYWRSFADLENSPEFIETLKNEFPAQAEELADPLSRRKFFQLMGASLALAGVAGPAGCRWEEDHIVPLSRRPDNYVPGVAKYFATAYEQGGAAQGLVVQSFDGRPVKIEGNPDHPYTTGATTTFAQASILSLYDPDRSQAPIRRQSGKVVPSTWEDFDTEFAKLRGNAGGLRILCEATSSPTVAALRKEIENKFAGVKWHQWEPVSLDNERDGLKMAFGSPHRAHYDLQTTKIIVALDCDLLGDHPAQLRHGKDWAVARNPEEGEAAMSRLYAVESGFSLTGAVADHRLPVRSELVKPILLALEAAIGGTAVSSQGTGATILDEQDVAKFVTAMATDLRDRKNAGRSLIAVGAGQPPEIHAIVARLNARLGNVGRTVKYSVDPEPSRPRYTDDLKTLVADMSQGAVKTLLIIGGNPVFDGPSNINFAAALAKVSNSIHLSESDNETSALCNWHLPKSHYLEAWGDLRTWDGTYSVQQPLIAPLYASRSTIEVLKALVGRDFENPLDLVRSIAGAVKPGLDDRSWRKAVHDGFIKDTGYKSAAPTVGSFNITQLTPSQKAGHHLPTGQLEVSLVASRSVYDGRYANSAWMQELPDFMTKVTWDNAALIAPRTASDLNISNQEMVSLSVGGKTIEVAAYVMPGQAQSTITLALGYGRTRAGVVGGHEERRVPSVGVNAYPLRTTGAAAFATGGTIKGLGKSHALASTQDHWALDTLGRETTQHRIDELVKSTDVNNYSSNRGFVKDNVHLEILGPLVQPRTAAKAKLSLFDEKTYNNHKWGMTMDLGSCIGCNACVVACQSENNIPVVGKEQVLKNREMHWIRLDRYFKGNPDNPEVAHQPIHCQQCENAPCEQVCPVGATIHSSEGLNDMVYNRCVGTRYCLNNCPYRVRRFNFHHWNEDLNAARNKVRQLMMNPQVTVRSRGVMEKCTWCIQRITDKKIKAKNERRELLDGEIKTACQQVCPTDAIMFGDLADKNSKVSELQNLDRAYALLSELNDKPRNAFLAKITNPHRDLIPEDTGKKAH